MDVIHTNEVIKIRPDAIESIRGKYGLNGPGRMSEAVNILEEWVRQQPHFRKKDFAKRYLESFILGTKGSIEKAKLRLDKLCTMRTMLPQYFGHVNVKQDLSNLFHYICPVILPQSTEDYCRVFVLKVLNDQFSKTDYFNYFRFVVALIEYEKLHGYMDGCIVVLDLSDASILECLNRIDLLMTKHAATIFLDCYSIRLRSMHIITKSQFVGTLISFMKQILGPKLGDRISAHKTASELHDVIDKKILPKDYGGDDKCIRELRDVWIDVLSSREHREYLENIGTASTDEALRQKIKFNEEYAGMPGTFRALEVD